MALRILILISFLFLFFSSLELFTLYHQEKAGSTLLMPSYHCGTCLSGAPNVPQISWVPPAAWLGDKAPRAQSRGTTQGCLLSRRLTQRPARWLHAEKYHHPS